MRNSEEQAEYIMKLEAQLKASQAIIKEAHDKLLNVNVLSWGETAWEVKKLLKIKEPKQRTNECEYCTQGCCEFHDVLIEPKS
jgi:hypothetical protein